MTTKKSEEKPVEGIGDVRFRKPVRVLFEYLEFRYENRDVTGVRASLLDHTGPYVFARGSSEERALEGLGKRIKRYLVGLRKLSDPGILKDERPKYHESFVKRLESLRALVK